MLMLMMMMMMMMMIALDVHLENFKTITGVVKNW